MDAKQFLEVAKAKQAELAFVYWESPSDTHVQWKFRSMLINYWPSTERVQWQGKVEAIEISLPEYLCPEAMIAVVEELYHKLCSRDMAQCKIGGAYWP